MFSVGGVDNFSIGLWLESEIEISIFENRFLIFSVEVLLVDAIVDDNFAVDDDFGFEASTMGYELIIVWFGWVRSLFEHKKLGIRLDDFSIVDDGVDNGLVGLSKSTYMDVYV